MINFRILAIACCVLVVSGCASSVDFVANKLFLPNDGIREASHAVWTERRVGFSTSDGVQLLADIHHPQDLEKTPTILVRIPLTNTFLNRLRADAVGRYWAKRGYTVVMQGTRGRYESGGDFYPLIHERGDGLETLRWLEKASWYDGRIAMWGGSAFGHTQWSIADQTSPNVDSFFVQIASTNFREMFYPGNAFSLESALYWTIRSRGNRDREVNYDDLERGVNVLPIIEADDRAVGDTAFFNDWLVQRDNAKYWSKIDGTHRTATLQAPILLLAGWFDPFLPTQLTDFGEIIASSKTNVAANTRLIIGPWGHATSVEIPGAANDNPYRNASISPSIAWFDNQLGVSDKPLDMPRVKLFVMGINKWREEREWPLDRTSYTPFYLHSNGGANTATGDGVINSVPPDVNEPVDSYSYDPLNPTPTAGGALLGERSGIRLQNEIETRNDVLVYSTASLEKPIEVTGPVKAILYVSTDAASTDFTAKLVDVYPDGSAYNVSDGILRRNYVTMDGGTRIELQLWPTSIVFLEGHKIRLEISSSNFPRYDRNLNTGDRSPTAHTTRVANQVVYHSVKHPSHLVLPIIPTLAH